MSETRSKVMYGAGGFAMHASNFLLVTWLTKYYTPGPGKHLVAPVLFANIILFGRIVDAIADPIVGYWSDHHEGKHGRRIPFIKWGAPFLALFTLLAFTPPNQGQQTTLNGVYLALILAGFFCFYTIVVTPYLSLLPEMTEDEKERINYTTIQGLFILLATIYVAALAGPLIAAMGYFWFMLLSAVLVYASCMAPLAVARPKPYQRPEGMGKSSVKDIVRWSLTTLESKPFRHVLISTSMFWFGLNLLMAGVAVWVTNVLGGKEADVAVVMGPLILANLIGFPLINKLANSKGKYLAFMVVFFGMVLACPWWYFVQRLPGDLPYLHGMIVFFCVGFPLAGFQVLPYAVLSDVIDEDAQRNGGQRREAIFFGMQAIIQKTMIGLSMVVLQYMRIGFGEKMGLRLLGPVAAVCCLIAMFGFWGYPLREDHLQEKGEASEQSSDQASAKQSDD